MIGKIDLWGIFSDIKKEFNWELTGMQKNLVMEIMIRSEKMEKEQKSPPSKSSAEEAIWERTFSLKEALEIATDYYSFGMDAAIDIDCGHSPSSLTNQQYFKDKFGIEI